MATVETKSGRSQMTMNLTHLKTKLVRRAKITLEALKTCQDSSKDKTLESLTLRCDSPQDLATATL